MLIAQVKLGWNRHAWDVRPSTVAIGEKLSLTSQILFAVASISTRISMLLLTRRILVTGYEKLKKFISFLMVWMATNCLIFCFVVVFQCK